MGQGKKSSSLDISFALRLRGFRVRHFLIAVYIILWPTVPGDARSMPPPPGDTGVVIKHSNRDAHAKHAAKRYPHKRAVVRCQHQ
jgi:hypothetical protein